LGRKRSLVSYHSVQKWYAAQPTPVVEPPPLAQRLPVPRDNQGNWLYDPRNQVPGKPLELDEEMKQMKARWAEKAA
jgi:hypothetical protein